MKLTSFLLLFFISSYSHAQTIEWKETLNFRLGGKNIYNTQTTALDDVNSWHISKRDLLNTAYHHGGRPNFVVARLGMIYSIPDNEALYVKYLEIPYLFASGWSAPTGSRDTLFNRGSFYNRIQTRTGYHQNRLLFLGDIVADSLHFDPDNVHGNMNGNDILYCTHLVNTFSGYGRGGLLYDLNPRRGLFSEQTRFLNGLYHGNIINLRSDPHGSRFKSRFYDTEQAIYLKIQKSFNWGFIEPTNPLRRHFFNPDNPDRIPENAMIHLCKIDIASYFDMCRDCSCTGHALIRAKRGFYDSIFSAMREWQINTSDDLSCFIEVSGQHQTHMPYGMPWRSRIDNLLIPFNNTAAPFDIVPATEVIAQIGF